MFIWSADRIKWYQEAANYTKYYKEIFDQIERYIEKEDDVCDLGCGLGDLSLEIARIANNVTAIDISQDALDVLETKAREREVENITTLQSNWTNLALTPQWDIVVVSFFRQNYEDFIKLLKMARKRIIVVGTNGSEDNFLPKQKEHKNRGKIASLKEIFTSHGLEFTCIERTVQFGQPLQSIDDARAYIKDYVADCPEDEMEAHIEKWLRPIETGEFAGQYYFSNKKEIGIFIIEKAEAIKKLPELR